ncbi:unnamed protein product [Fusarium graminearum]|uniref:Uncharacterized protein n=1 Tax=Gibberella zeae TaxID=5518 RepID=A0A4E9D0J7_GIBZA|nr:unnamed protein product [Fusarium graminearum]
MQEPLAASLSPVDDSTGKLDSNRASSSKIWSRFWTLLSLRARGTSISSPGELPVDTCWVIRHSSAPSQNLCGQAQPLIHIKSA